MKLFDEATDIHEDAAWVNRDTPVVEPEPEPLYNERTEREVEDDDIDAVLWRDGTWLGWDEAA